MTSKFWKSWYSHSSRLLSKFWSSKWTSLSGFSCDQVGRQTRGERGPKGRCWHHQLCFSCWHNLYFLSSFLHFHDGCRKQDIPRSLCMGLGTITYSPLLSTSFWIRKSFSTKKSCHTLKWKLKAALRVPDSNIIPHLWEDFSGPFTL